MLIRISLASLLALTACSDDPKPKEAVTTEAASGEPPLTDDPATAAEPNAPENATAEVAPEAAPAPAKPVIAVKAAAAPKAGTKEVAKAAPVKAAPAKVVAVTAAPTPDNIFWVFVDGANIRSAPSLSAKVVGTLTWGDKLTSLGTTKDFVKIGEGKFVHRTMVTDRKQHFGTAKSAH